MKIIVFLHGISNYKNSLDDNSSDQNINNNNCKATINLFDEIALEEAIKLKESGLAKDIVVVSIGSPETQEILRLALALGADRSILIESFEKLDPLNTAKILKFIVNIENPLLILFGSQCIKNEFSQLGQMLSALINFSQATFVSKIIFKNKNNIIATQLINNIIEIIDINLPAVITVNIDLNNPRYITLSNIIKAKKKVISVIRLKDININIKSCLYVLKSKKDYFSSKKQILSNPKELIEKLKIEEKVL